MKVLKQNFELTHISRSQTITDELLDDSSDDAGCC